jgi:hypothetical protein
VGRKAWISTLLATAIAVLLVTAWIDGGRRPRHWIELPITAGTAR